MKYWFIIHSLKSYEQHSDMIGCKFKQKGGNEPCSRCFADIREGDKIVYYATFDGVIVGLFTVVSAMESLKDDPYWGNKLVYRIKPEEMLPEGYCCDLKRAVLNDGIKLQIFPQHTRYYHYLHGRTCKHLNKKDYLVMRKLLQNVKYLTQKEIHIK